MSVDTDVLGTFTGETPRQGTMLETALSKARLGMKATGLPLGLASEGSFAPHPKIWLLPSDCEILVFIDEEEGFFVSEQLITTTTNSGLSRCSSEVEALKFAARSGFPAHFLVVRPVGNDDPDCIRKGIRAEPELRKAVHGAIMQSPAKLAQVETDMRAHANPTRMKIIRRLGARLARRLRTLCSVCGCPGFGMTGTEPGLPCAGCGLPTSLVLREIHSCPRCQFDIRLPRKDGLLFSDARHCPFCNP
jgi:hypothetical protein